MRVQYGKQKLSRIYLKESEKIETNREIIFLYLKKGKDSQLRP